MIVLGLTGGIGMGKTTADRLLRGRGVPVVDTDVLARELVEPGQPALAEIVAKFGPKLLGSDGLLDRRALAHIVFGDPSQRVALEQILHPRIRACWLEQLEQWRHQARGLAVVVIPLLFETGAEKDLDHVVCVACSRATQQSRLLSRGWNPEQIELRNRAQLPVEEKISRAHYLVWTEGSLELHARQLEAILARV